ncbi:hypothetical protein Dsin_018690 [Dipteronia sinensis]|uniref:Endonuclease/exonuclease/phosphatase n=1 Tax=Dipteronia sinensis TaxID=43782 RepID=A0AAE0E3B9_9ROSI|nr:hypothetical protein Dsin_018690 [Dipteronia sinensis]
MTKYGSWMRASISDRPKSKGMQFESNVSSEKGRNLGVTKERLAGETGVSFGRKAGILVAEEGECAGAGEPPCVGGLEKAVKKHSPDLVFLSKTKINRSWANSIKVQLGFTSGISVDSIGKSGGLLLMWKDSLSVAVLSYSIGHMDAQIQMEDGFRWRFSGFYGNPKPSHRMHSWNLMRHIRAVDDLPWACRGDFNELLNLSKKMGGSEKSFS